MRKNLFAKKNNIGFVSFNSLLYFNYLFLLFRLSTPEDIKFNSVPNQQHSLTLGPRPCFNSVPHQQHSLTIGPRPCFNSVPNQQHSLTIGPRPCFNSVPNQQHSLTIGPRPCLRFRLLPRSYCRSPFQLCSRGKHKMLR